MCVSTGSHEGAWLWAGLPTEPHAAKQLGSSHPLWALCSSNGLMFNRKASCCSVLYHKQMLCFIKKTSAPWRCQKAEKKPRFQRHKHLMARLDDLGPDICWVYWEYRIHTHTHGYTRVHMDTLDTPYTGRTRKGARKSPVTEILVHWKFTVENPIFATRVSPLLAPAQEPETRFFFFFRGSQRLKISYHQKNP